MFEREEISDCQWDSGKYDRAADGNWENCVRSQGAYFEGDWGVTVLCTMFLVSCIFFNKCLFFIVHAWILSEQTLWESKRFLWTQNDNAPPPTTAWLAVSCHSALSSDLKGPLSEELIWSIFSLPHRLSHLYSFLYNSHTWNYLL